MLLRKWEKWSVAIVGLLCLAVGASAQTLPDEANEAAQLSAKVVRLYQAGQFTEALPLAERALVLREKALGAEHPDTASATFNVASLHFRLNHLGQAEVFAQRALAIYEKQKPPRTEDLSGTLFLLGGIAYSRADYEPAAERVSRALALREQLYGAEHQDTLDAVLLLAHVNYGRREFDAAAFLYRGYLEREEKRGVNSMLIGSVTERLGCTLWKRADEDEAKKVMTRADTLLSYPTATRTVSSKQLRENQLSQPNVNVRLAPKDAERLEETPWLRRGEIAVRVLINAQGQVLRACAYTGFTPLWNYYETAAKGVRFRPFTDKNGQPVAVMGNLNFEYEIARRGPFRRRQ